MINYFFFSVSAQCILQFFFCIFLCLQDDDCNFYFMWYTRAACPSIKSVDCTVMQNGQFYDLRQLTDPMYNHVVVKRQSHLKFLLNVCHSVVFGKDAFCQYSSAACLVNLSNPDPTSRCTLFI
jgi:hypothetical protein